MVNFLDYTLIPSEKLSFASSDICEICEEKKEIKLSFMGLFGVDSPLPHYFLVEALHNEALREFLNIFNQRLYQLFYMSIKKSRLMCQQEKYCQYLIAISGNKLAVKDTSLFAGAGLLGLKQKSRVGLISLLRNYLGGVPVTVHENIAQWISVKTEQKLGEDFILGNKILDKGSKIIVEIGPVSLERALAYRKNNALRDIISRYVDTHITYDIRLNIIPEKKSVFILGLSWLGECSSQSMVQIML